MSISSALESPAPISAIVTGYRRANQLLRTISRIKNCSPPPAEILVHLDDNERETACATAVRGAFPDVNVIVSQGNVGPGGGRTKLINAASHPVIASFDDDSYPIDPDYFARLGIVFNCFPNAAIVCATLFHRGEVDA